MSVSTNVTTPLGSSTSADVLVRLLRPRLRGGLRERGVLREDGALERPQALAWLDPQLLDEPGPGVLIRLKGVGLPVRAVEGEHQLGSQALAVRVLLDQALELTHQLRVAAERQLRLDQQLEARDPQVLEARDLRLRERLVGEVGQRRAAPQRERLLERRDGALRPLVRELPAGLAEQSLEPVGVHVVRLDAQLVAVPVRDDRPVRAGTRGARERAPQP